MIKSLAKAQIVVSLCVAAFLYVFVNQNVAITSLSTSVVLLANLYGLFIFWRIVFLKKSIALGLLIIIFKYPLIALCIWQISKQPWVQLEGILVSMLAFIVSIVGVVLYKQRRGHAL